MSDTFWAWDKAEGTSSSLGLCPRKQVGTEFGACAVEPEVSACAHVPQAPLVAGPVPCDGSSAGFRPLLWFLLCPLLGDNTDK